MLQVFQNLSGTMDPEQICNMDVDMPLAWSMHLHCKDLRGHYIAINSRLAVDVGYQSKDELLGQTDYEIDCLAENEPETFRAIDKHVLATDKTHFFTQSVTLADGNKYIAMNHKMPLRSRQNNVIGVLSFGIVMNAFHSAYYDPNYPALNILFSTNSQLLQTLTQRQVDCLYFLIRGFSIKEIAKQLSLSPRTVEHYLEAVKDKLGCQTRSDIVNKIMKMSL